MESLSKRSLFTGSQTEKTNMPSNKKILQNNILQESIKDKVTMIRKKRPETRIVSLSKIREIPISEIVPTEDLGYQIYTHQMIFDNVRDLPDHIRVQDGEYSFVWNRIENLYFTKCRLDDRWMKSMTDNTLKKMGIENPKTILKTISLCKIGGL